MLLLRIGVCWQAAFCSTSAKQTPVLRSTRNLCLQPKTTTHIQPLDMVSKQSLYIRNRPLSHFQITSTLYPATHQHLGLECTSRRRTLKSHGY
mgnify:CR=1 FL=1